MEQDLYSTWLGEELNNMTACIRAPTSITVNEPYNMRGMWVSVNKRIKPTIANEYNILFSSITLQQTIPTMFYPKPLMELLFSIIQPPINTYIQIKDEDSQWSELRPGEKKTPHWLIKNELQPHFWSDNLGSIHHTSLSVCRACLSS